MIAVLSVGSASANTNSAHECEQQLTPTTMADLRALYNKSVSPSLTPEQRLMAASLYRQKLEAAEAAYFITKERLHAWMIDQSELSSQDKDDSSQTVTSTIQIPPRLTYNPRLIQELHGHKDKIINAAFSADSTMVVTTSKDGTAQIWNVTTGEEILTLKGHEDTVKSAAFSHDGTRIITTSSDKTARIWSTTTGEKILTLSGHWKAVTSAAFSADDKRVITASDDRDARIWDAITGEKIHRLQDFNSIEYAAFSPDGTMAVTTTVNSAQTWNAITGKKICAFIGHKEAINHAAFSPDGKQIVTASDDQTVQIWDSVTGEKINSLKNHWREIKSAVFSPDSSRLTTVYTDTTVQILNTTTWAVIHTLKLQNGWVNFASFSADSTKVIIQALDNTVRIWSLYLTEEDLLSDRSEPSIVEGSL